MERISPTNDLSFKKVFGSNEHKDCLKGLIADFLSIEVPQEDITIEHPYSIEAFSEIKSGAEVLKMRETIKDIAASLKFSDFISELQLKKTRFFAERILYYPFDRFCQNYNRYGYMEMDKEGKPNRYSSLRPVYALNILGSSYFTQDDEALRIFELYDPKRNKRFSKDLIRIGFFELGKTHIETINQKHWRDYFLTGDVSVDAPEYIKKASKIIEVFNLSEEEKRVATLLERTEARLDAERSDYYNEGKDVGRQEEKIQMVKTMLKEGLSLEIVEKCTGLTLEQIKVIRG